MMSKMTSKKSDYGLGYTSSRLGEPSIYKHSITSPPSDLDVDYDSLAPYEKKAKELERREKNKSRSGGARGGGGGTDIDIEGLPKRLRPGGKQFKKGGSVSASKRGDGIAQRGKTRGRII